MCINDLLDKVNKEKRTRVRMEAIHHVVMGIGALTVIFAAAGILLNTPKGKIFMKKLVNKATNEADVIEDKVVKTTSTVKHAVVTALNKAEDNLEDLHKKAEDLKDDLTDAQLKIADDIRETAGHISGHFESE